MPLERNLAMSSILEITPFYLVSKIHGNPISGHILLFSGDVKLCFLSVAVSQLQAKPSNIAELKQT